MVPSGWTDGRVEDLLNGLESGVSVNGEDRQLLNGEKGVLRVSAVTYGTFDPSAVKVIERQEELDRAKINPKKSQIIISRSNTENLVGASAYINSDYPDLFLPDKLWQTIPKPTSNMKWLSYVLSSKPVRYTLSNLATGTSGSMKNITKGEFLSLKIGIPPLLEQQKIAKILSTWDKAISTTERLIENSTQQKKALMQQLLTGKKRLLDDEGKRFEGEWEEVILQSVLDLMRSGLSRKLENENVGIAVIRSNNMGSKYTNDVDLKYWYLDDPQGANVSNYILDDGDLLVNFINSASQIGKACIYRKNLDVDAIYTTNILRIKPNIDKVDPIYLYLLTQTANYDSYITSITKPAVNQASFTTKEFGNLKFNLPPLKEQQKIATVLTNADQEIELLEQQLADLQQEKKALMQVLLTGKKRVMVDGEE